MKVKIMKRCVALLLVTVLSLGLVGCSETENATSETEEDAFVSSSENSETTDSAEEVISSAWFYDEDYVCQHIEFLNSEDYKTISATRGSLASSLSEAYENASLNSVDQAWQWISSVGGLFGKGDVDDTLTDALTLTNEYELLVAYLMNTTASEEVVEDIYLSDYISSTEEILTSLAKILGDVNDASEAVQYLYKTIDAFETLEGTTTAAKAANAQTLFLDALDKVEGVYKALPSASQTTIQAGLGMIGAATDVMKYTSASISEVLEASALYATCVQASSEWMQIWSNISAAARASGDEEGERLADQIDEILERIQLTDESTITMIVQEVAEAATGNAVALSVSMASKTLDVVMLKWPMGRAVRMGLISGIAVSNVLTNMDDIAYYGEMMLKTGILAKYAYDVMENVATELMEVTKDGTVTNTNEAYEAALRLDEAFNIYKEIQIAACDYGIAYEQEIATAPLGSIFKYTSDDEIVTTTLLLADKADWSSYLCHDYSYEVINNGGTAVGYMGSTYYWRYHEGSFEDTALYGNFSAVSGEVNQLICRTSDGTETVFLEDCGYGQIYIVGEYLFYRTDYSAWKSCKLDGTPFGSYESILVYGASEKEQALVVYDYSGDDSVYVTLYPDGTRVTLADGNADYIGIYGDYMYYGIHVDDGLALEVYKTRVDGMGEGATELLATVYTSEEAASWGYISAGDAIFCDEGLYLCYGVYAGTGIFFSDGGISLINYDGGSRTLVYADSDQELTFATIYLQETENADGTTEQTLYYQSGDGYSYVDLWNDSWVTEDVYALDLSSGESAASTFTLSGIGDVVFDNGSVSVLLDNSGVYTEILSTAQAQALGYSGIGIEDSEYNSGSNTVYISDLDIIDGYAYFTVAEILADNTLNVGWRQGYRCISMRRYVTEIGSGEFTLLNEY